ncbi:hypothetical protein ABEB36_015453 [Hypothenemus hampei]|uniref:Uncharacterized protein n=1 Tax=Hypothenemus hampei TaxID=57062 RepID=A0ABD1E0I4_HYPHA
MFGKNIDALKLMKKINNMKTRMKAKTDKNKTGNKPIKMCEWEKIMYEALQGDANPTVSKIPGAISCGVSETFLISNPQKESLKRPALVLQNEAASSSSTSNSSTCLSIPLPPPRKNLLQHLLKKLKKQEGLPMEKMQRLVLMEQLQTLRIEREYYKLKIKRLENKNNTNNN